MSQKSIERSLALISIVILLTAWISGIQRARGAALERLQGVTAGIEGMKPLGPTVFEGRRKDGDGEKVRIGLAEHPGYAGPLQVAVAVDARGSIERVALLHTTDTGPYIDRVLREGVLDAYLGRSADRLPRVDAVTGATLSSRAMIAGVEKAAADILGKPAEGENNTSLSASEAVKLSVAAALFVVAAIISRRAFKGNRRYARLGLLTLSTATLGFLYGAQFSLSSLALLLTGLWAKGVASWAPLACLILSITYFLLARKNIYCAMICPFGGVQEGLGRITGCSPPRRAPWMKWTARLFTLLALAAALHLRTPAGAAYEPFGMAFSLIGSTALFALTILVVIASLVIRRPWCNLLCPITSIFD